MLPRLAVTMKLQKLMRKAECASEKESVLLRLAVCSLQVLKGLLGKGHDIPVAIKAVHENTSASQRDSLLQEISLLRSLRHGNIVTLFGACQEVRLYIEAPICTPLGLGFKT